jgi:hypothetical protein
MGLRNVMIVRYLTCDGVHTLTVYQSSAPMIPAPMIVVIQGITMTDAADVDAMTTIVAEETMIVDTATTTEVIEEAMGATMTAGAGMTTGGIDCRNIKGRSPNRGHSYVFFRLGLYLVTIWLEISDFYLLRGRSSVGRTSISYAHLKDVFFPSKTLHLFYYLTHLLKLHPFTRAVSIYLFTITNGFNKADFQGQPLHGFYVGHEFFNILLCALGIDHAWVSDFCKTSDGERGRPLL